MTEQDDYETPVLFRIGRSKRYDVTAVFPAECHNLEGDYVTCYAHIGQHGACALYIMMGRKYRRANPSEYRALFNELTGLGYRLKIYQRATPQHARTRRSEQSRLRNRDRAAS